MRSLPKRQWWQECSFANKLAVSKSSVGNTEGFRVANYALHMLPQLAML